MLTYDGLGLLLLGLPLLPSGFGLLGDFLLRSELLLAVAGRVKNVLRSLDIVFFSCNQSMAALRGFRSFGDPDPVGSET